MAWRTSQVQAHISSLHVMGLKIHRKPTRFQKRKSHTITPHRPTPNPYQKRMIQKTSFATTPTSPSSFSSTVRQI